MAWYNNLFGGNNYAQVDTAISNQAQANAGAVGPLSSSNTAGTSYQPVAPAAVGGQQGAGMWGNQGGGFANTAGMVLSGVQTLGSLWNAYQQQKIAKETLAFQKDAFKTNLKNSTQTYNTALEDRIRARHNTEGKSSGETDSYLKKHSL